MQSAQESVMAVAYNIEEIRRRYATVTTIEKGNLFVYCTILLVQSIWKQKLSSIVIYWIVMR